MPMPVAKLQVAPLTREAFAAFGDVIETDGADHFTINQGTTERYHDLAGVELGEGRALISVFRAEPRSFPMELDMMERHPLGSQAFMPMNGADFLVVVAPAGPAPAPDDLRAFLAKGGQGVNYRAGVWHYPVLALCRQTDFLVVDRGGPGNNLDEVTLEGGPVILDFEG